MYPDPLFSLFGSEVNLYGIFIAIGILVCFLVYFLYTKKDGMDKDLQSFTFYVAIISIVLGFLAAALFQSFYVFLETGVFKFGVGITVMGGLLGGAGTFLLVYFLVGKFYFQGEKKDIHKKQFNKILRIAPICIVIAHAFGRISCLMAGCCHGAYLGKEYVFGGIWMHGTVDGFSRWGYYVPTQLYESLFLFCLFAVLSVLYFKKSSLILQIYLIAYGVWRIIIEIFRTDKRGYVFLGLQPSQWMSILFIAIGVGLILLYYFKKIPFWDGVAPKCAKVIEGEENQAESQEISQEKPKKITYKCSKCGAVFTSTDSENPVCKYCKTPIEK